MKPKCEESLSDIGFRCNLKALRLGMNDAAYVLRMLQGKPVVG